MNFALILFILTAITGAIWLIDVLFLKKKRAVDAQDPWWVEYGASFFPVILAVFLLRSFLVEPFKIPSGSMLPTLLVGDFILVNKYTYGIRLPVINKKIIDINTPQRGDVMVFRYPSDPSIDYIKRVVGVPGDRVAYIDKRLTINGEELPVQRTGDYVDSRLISTPRYIEKIGDVVHEILIDADAPAGIPRPGEFPFASNCDYNSSGMVCQVPPGHYFLMGDNRDNSQDSRYWGFVPDENIVGKAFGIWFHAESLLPPRGIDLKRIGSFR